MGVKGQFSGAAEKLSPNAQLSFTCQSPCPRPGQSHWGGSQQSGQGPEGKEEAELRTGVSTIYLAIIPRPQSQGLSPSSAATDVPKTLSLPVPFQLKQKTSLLSLLTGAFHTPGLNAPSFTQL